MKNKELLNTAKIEFNNWLLGSNAGEFGIDDLLDVCYNLIPFQTLSLKFLQQSFILIV